MPFGLGWVPEHGHFAYLIRFALGDSMRANAWAGSGRRGTQLRECPPAFGLRLYFAALSAPPALSCRCGGRAVCMTSNASEVGVEPHLRAIIVCSTFSMACFGMVGFR